MQTQGRKHLTGGPADEEKGIRITVMNAAPVPIDTISGSVSAYKRYVALPWDFGKCVSRKCHNPCMRMPQYCSSTVPRTLSDIGHRQW